MVQSPSVNEQAPRPVPLTAFEKRFKHPPGLVVLFFAAAGLSMLFDRRKAKRQAEFLPPEAAA